MQSISAMGASCRQRKFTPAFLLFLEVREIACALREHTHACGAVQHPILCCTALNLVLYSTIQHPGV